MRNNMLLLLSLFLLFIFYGCRSKSVTSLEWQSPSFTEESFIEDGRLLMYFFSSEQCSYCSKVEGEHFQNYEVVSFLNDNFTCVNVVQGDDASFELMEQYHVSAFPTFLFLETDLSERGRITGYKNVEQFLVRLNEIENNINTLDYYLRKNTEEGGVRYLLNIFRTYLERKDTENLLAVADEIRINAPEIYFQSEEFICSSISDVLFANQLYIEFVPEMQKLLALKAERYMRSEYLKLATAYSRQHEFEKAQNIFILLLKLIQTDITVYTDYLRFLSLNYIKENDLTEIEAGFKLDSSNDELAEFCYWFSRYRRTLGDTTGSQQYLEQAVSLNPERYTHFIEEEEQKSNLAFSIFPMEVTFPDTEEGSVLEETFIISNKADLLLNLKVISTCNCLTVSESVLQLGAGQQQSIFAILDTAGESGDVERFLIVREIEGKEPEARISFKVFVKE